MTKEIIIYKESLLQSIVADIFTFGVLSGLMFFNHYILEDSKFAGFIFIILWLVFLSSKFNDRKKTFTNKDEAIKYLNK